MTRFVFPLLLGLIATLTAEAGRYRASEGRIYVAVSDAETIARDERGSLAVAIGQLIGADIQRKVCEGTAEKIRATINDPADPEVYVPSVVQCELVAFETEWPWIYSAASSDTFEVVSSPPGNYYVVSVEVTDPAATASAREGRRKVRLAKMLGLSIEGRVNEELMYGILERMNDRGIDSFVTTF